DELVVQIEERKKRQKKVSAENARLREKVEELLNAAGSGRCSPGHPDGLSASPEMLVVSHRVSERCPAECCLHSSAPHGSPRSPPVPNDCDDGLLQMKDIFRQLRREHSLLRDVMLISYRRQWFREDAVPYVRRTLRKCGTQLDPLD
ncbi:kinesin-like protein K39 isoform X2, partial [Arapaima gigas]